MSNQYKRIPQPVLANNYYYRGEDRQYKHGELAQRDEEGTRFVGDDTLFPKDLVLYERTPDYIHKGTYGGRRSRRRSRRSRGRTAKKSRGSRSKK